MSHGMSAHVDKATFLEEDQFFSRESIMRPPACSLCPGPYQQLVHYCLSVASHQSAKLGIQPTEKTMAWARIILPLNMPVSIAPAVFFGVRACLAQLPLVRVSVQVQLKPSWQCSRLQQ